MTIKNQHLRLGSNFTLTQQQLYGSSHIGTRKPDLDMVNPPTASNTRTLGLKSYFLGDHRGNNNVTVSDRKKAIEDIGNPGTIAYYEPFIVRAVDYFPFGREMNGRIFFKDESEFGYNGKQNIKEWSSRLGGPQNFGGRIKYDVWFITPDKIMQPHESPYAYVANNPIIYVDIEGEDNVIYLVVLPSANEKLSKEDIQGIVDKANQNFKDLGLKTRVVLYEHSEPFNPEFLDGTDSYSLLGSVGEIKETIKENNYSDIKVDMDLWKGGAGSPEESTIDGTGILIDVNALEGFSKEVKDTKPNAAAFLLTHGSTHNANGRHRTLGSTTVGTDGAIIAAFINQDDKSVIRYTESGRILQINKPTVTKLSDFMKPENNKKVIELMENRFGTNNATDNYYFNKRKSEGAPRPNIGMGKIPTVDETIKSQKAAESKAGTTEGKKEQ